MQRTYEVLLKLTAIGIVVASASPILAGGEPFKLDNTDIERVLPKSEDYSPWVQQNYPQRPYFGDTHVHTSLSFDGVTFGTKLDAHDAYRFAKGKEVTTSTGLRARLSRPLDFIVVADHAESLGVFNAIRDGDPLLMEVPRLRRWRDALREGGDAALGPYLEFLDLLNQGEQIPELSNPDIFRSAWKQNVDAAEAHNDPGAFTAFIGYEWTSNDGGDNLHRVVIYRDGVDKALQTLPFDANISPNPEDLWTALGEYEAKTGGTVMAIPHNGNLSNGLMFDDTQYDGSAITEEWAKTRRKYEILYEATQIKGDGEAHPFLSADDEFADYETWDKGNLDLTVPKEAEMLQHEYARSALKLGLQIQAQIGFNPYQFGMIGSSDAHTALAAVAEDNFFGKMPHMEPSSYRMVSAIMEDERVSVNGTEMASSGYAAVWATENTREALFDAMKRRETYATTGSRMVVRLFGGFDFTEDDALTRRPAIVGYDKGVPMGATLRGAPDGKAPRFLVAALRDPIGANLDRYQIVKGWIDPEGTLHEKVYDVAWGGERSLDSDGKLPGVGDTVDVETANYTNTIGAPELVNVWTDPDFDPDQPAFYYGRVLEIPTPRWSTYDAVHFGVELPTDVPAAHQERAYTSPIWYQPE
ncbi:DUF3604 domain-containing protein [Ruegeria sp. Ofav3-42]|uniref:DUF3604 domain-containing protein n=1 Tax=Ruegeria sp. Ofav3-42 TaxID=2917759 RepID=UPI001EF4D809|nr:DUF3604 domain-containing protein [Ruegeria sp. Ofav3-42]MCG7522510.1 DUF3604 domain-containing protein [Ruegeria sp. Ofav3-42]